MDKTLTQIKLEELYKRVFRDERFVSEMAERTRKITERLFEGDEEGLDEMAESLLTNKEDFDAIVFESIRTMTAMLG